MELRKCMCSLYLFSRLFGVMPCFPQSNDIQHSHIHGAFLCDRCHATQLIDSIPFNLDYNAGGGINVT